MRVAPISRGCCEDCTRNHLHEASASNQTIAHPSSDTQHQRMLRKEKHDLKGKQSDLQSNKEQTMEPLPPSPSPTNRTVIGTVRCRSQFQKEREATASQEDDFPAHAGLACAWVAGLGLPLAPSLQIKTQEPAQKLSLASKVHAAPSGMNAECLTEPSRQRPLILTLQTESCELEPAAISSTGGFMNLSRSCQ